MQLRLLQVQPELWRKALWALVPSAMSLIEWASSLQMQQQ